MSYPMAYVLAVRSVESEMDAGRLDGPVRRPVESGGGRTVQLRIVAAQTLSALSRWVAPAERGTLACDGAAEGC